jgi:hypothetical protein
VNCGLEGAWEFWVWASLDSRWPLGTTPSISTWGHSERPSRSPSTTHTARRAAFDADARQRTRLAALGWANLTVTSQTLHETAWLDDLRQLLHERAPQLTLAI